MMAIFAALIVLLLFGVLHAQSANQLCPTSSITTDLVVSSGTDNIITSCVISAKVTITGATLVITGTTIAAAGHIVTDDESAHLTISSSSVIESDVEIIKGTVVISGSVIQNAGRIIGTGAGYAGATTETSLDLTGCDFKASTRVPPNQIEVLFTGSSPALGHSWSIQNSGFDDAGGIFFNTLRMASVVIKGNDFTKVTTAAGAITTVIDMSDSGMIADGTVSKIFWEISYNKGSYGTVDMVTNGAIALINIGSISPAPATTSSSVNIRFNNNEGFVQIIHEVTSSINLLPCAAGYVFEFRDNTGTLTNVADTLAVYDFGTMEFTGCPMQIITNRFDITHVNSAASSGVLSFYVHPGQPSITAASVSLTDNVVSIKAAGAVDGAFAYFKGRASGYYSCSTVLSGNTVVVDAFNGRAMLLYIDGQSAVQVPIKVTDTTGTFTSSSQSVVLGVMAATDLSIKNGFEIVLNTFTLSGNSASAALRILAGEKATLGHADAVLDFSDNVVVFNYPPTDLLAFTPGGVELTSGYLNFSSNVISGCTTPQRVMPSVYSGTSDAVGCNNRICGERVRNLRAETSGWVWEWCAVTTVTKTIVVNITTTTTDTTTATTTTPLAAQTTTSTTNPTTTTAVVAESNTTELPQSTPTEVSTTTGSIAVVASGVFVDSASTVQLTAILLVMACQTDEGSKSAARVFLTPLRVADMPSADLVGSLLLLIGICGVYFVVVSIVFAVLRRKGPSSGSPRIVVEEDTERSALHTPESADAEVAATIFRAKKFLFYPRIPILIATLLFPGIVLDSSSLLYGELSYNAAGWERFIGCLGIVAALALIAYEHTVAVVARRHVGAKDDTEPAIAFPAGDNADEWSEMDVSVSSPSHHGEHPSSQGNKYQSLSETPNEETTVMDSSVKSGSGILGQSGQSEIQVTNIRKTSLTRDTLRRNGSMTSGSLALGNFSIASLDTSGVIQSTAGRSFDTPSTSITMVPDGGRNEDEGTRPLNLQDDISREASVFGSQTSPCPDTHQISNSRLALALSSDEGSPDATPESMPWFIRFTNEGQLDQPWIVRNTLLAAGHWSTYVERSIFCIVTPARYEVMSWMIAHNLWRMLFFSMLGAISPADTSHCKYVQIFVAVVCFLHGFSLFVTRLFRIPALNPLQGMQSVFLGLLACAPFISDPVAQSGFSNTLMALSLLTVLFSIIAVIFEMRLQRQINQQQ